MHFPHSLRFLLACVVLTFVTACLWATPLTVGADRDYAPFSYLSNGRPTGFDVELYDLIAEELGRTVTYVLRPWAEIHELARAGELDVVLGVVYTPERDRYLDFTVPYNTFRFTLLAHEESGIQQAEDLKSRRLAYLENDAVAKVLMQDRGVDPEYLTFPTLSEAVRSVQDGRADAVIAPYEWARDSENDRFIRNLHMVTDNALVSTYRMGVTEAQPGLAAEIDGVLQEITTSSEYDALREKWFAGNDTQNASAQDPERAAGMLIIVVLVALIVGGIVLFVLIDRRANRL